MFLLLLMLHVRGNILYHIFVHSLFVSAFSVHPRPGAYIQFIVLVSEVDLEQGGIIEQIYGSPPPNLTITPPYTAIPFHLLARDVEFGI